MTTTTVYNSMIDDRSVWQNEEVFEYSGSLPALLQQVPLFERRPFAFDHSAAQAVQGNLFNSATLSGDTGINRHYDAVIRLPQAPHEQPLPVGIVSKTYALVQHRDIITLITQFLPNIGFKPEQVPARLLLSEYGTRMALRIVLKEKWAFNPGDDYPLWLCLDCVNSVDGSSRLRAGFHWFRQVCSNGLVIKENAEWHRIHTTGLELGDLRQFINDGLSRIDNAMRDITGLHATPVIEAKLIRWVDGPLAEKWGSHTATRAYYIIMRGLDGVIANPFEKAQAHERYLKDTINVPGAVIPGLNAYAVSQALAWLVGTRRDIEEQLARSRDINVLIEQLIGMN